MAQSEKPALTPEQMRRPLTARFLPAFMKVIADAMAGFVAKRLEPIERRLAALEDRPGLKYCGTWNKAQQANEGCFYTDQGSLWYCRRSTRDRPGTSNDWVLAAKRGRDGRDAS